jgi:hypothetical protein
MLKKKSKKVRRRNSFIERRSFPPLMACRIEYRARPMPTALNTQHTTISTKYTGETTTAMVILVLPLALLLALDFDQSAVCLVFSSYGGTSRRNALYEWKWDR